jgi:hypothetical protein
LREIDDPALLYPRLPYVYRHQQSVAHVPLYLTIEEWLEEAAEPVPQRRLRELVCDEMGFKSFQFDQLLGRLPNTVRTDAGEFVHLSTLGIKRQEIRGLVDYARDLVNRLGHVSATRLYRDKEVTCHLLGITGPVMLHSLLQLHGDDDLDMRQYPLVRLPGSSSKERSRGITEQVAAFLREQDRPCSYHEIEERFVGSLGYRAGTVLNVVNRDDVFRYLQSCVIHRAVVEWSEAKQAVLEAIAAQLFLECEKAGKWCGTCEDLLELYEDRLPQLANGITWTRRLLADLLDRGKSLTVLGNAHNAYVAQPNRSDIHNLDDLVWHIVQAEYRGAATVDEVSATLRRYGVIRKQLTASMLRDQHRVVLSGHIVTLGGLG